MYFTTTVSVALTLQPFAVLKAVNTNLPGASIIGLSVFSPEKICPPFKVVQVNELAEETEPSNSVVATKQLTSLSGPAFTPGGKQILKGSKYVVFPPWIFTWVPLQRAPRIIFVPLPEPTFMVA